MPNLHTHCEALELVAPGALAPHPLDRALLLSLLPQPLDGTPHG